jgi:hypothetical protein
MTATDLSPSTSRENFNASCAAGTANAYLCTDSKLDDSDRQKSINDRLLSVKLASRFARSSAVPTMGAAARNGTSKWMIFLMMPFHACSATSRLK